MIATAATIFAVLSLNMVVQGAIMPYRIVAVGLGNQADPDQVNPESNDFNTIKEEQEVDDSDTIEEDLALVKSEEIKNLLEIQAAASIIERILLKKRQSHRKK